MPMFTAMTCFIRKEIRHFCIGANSMALKMADGLGMLVAQAAHAVLLWHGRLPEIAPVIAVLHQELNA